MARALIASVPLAVVLVAAVVVPVSVTPGSFGFRGWPEPPQELAGEAPVVVRIADRSAPVTSLDVSQGSSAPLARRPATAASVAKGRPAPAHETRQHNPHALRPATHAPTHFQARSHADPGSFKHGAHKDHGGQQKHAWKRGNGRARSAGKNAVHAHGKNRRKNR